MTPLMRFGNQQPLQAEDLDVWGGSAEDDSASVLQRFREAFDRVKKDRDAQESRTHSSRWLQFRAWFRRVTSMTNAKDKETVSSASFTAARSYHQGLVKSALYTAFPFRYWLSGFVQLVLTGMRLMPPIFVHALLSFIAETDLDPEDRNPLYIGMLYVLALGRSSLLSSVFINLAMYLTVRGVRCLIHVSFVADGTLRMYVGVLRTVHDLLLFLALTQTRHHL